MSKLAEHYQVNLSEAINLFNIGFTSNAAKKMAVDRVNLAYDFLKKEFQEQLLAERSETTDCSIISILTDLYYSIPDLHNWKGKHITLFNNYPLFVNAVNELAQLRQAIKCSEVVKTVKTPQIVTEKTNQVREAIKGEFQRKNDQVINGLDLAAQFDNRLPVSVNAHTVTNNKGTTFTRNFFFLDGKLTALSVIIEIYQRLLNK